MELLSLKPLLRRGCTFVPWLRHSRKWVVKMVDGIRYELSLNEAIDSSIYFLGAFEPDSVSAIKRLIKRSDIVLDVQSGLELNEKPLPAA